MRRHAIALSLAWMALRLLRRLRSRAAWWRAAQDRPAAQVSIPETKFDVPEASRRAILFTKYALDVRLETREMRLYMRGRSSR